jgi:hypothetical protein
MKKPDEIENLKTNLVKLEGTVLFLLSITSIQFLLIIILFLKR